MLKKNNNIRFTKSVKDFLLKDGSHRQWGARPIRRIIQNEIENAISTKFLLNEFVDKATISVKVQDDNLIFTIQKTYINLKVKKLPKCPINTFRYA